MSLRKTNEFDDAVLDMNAEYIMSSLKTPKDVMQFIKKIDGDSKDDYFMMDSYNSTEFDDSSSRKRK